jgi:hypothetical protein
MHTRKLAVLTASAALAIGGLAFVTGCDSDKDNSRRSDTGVYNGDVDTAGYRTEPGDPDNSNPNGTYGTGAYGDVDRSATGYTGTNSGTGAGGARGGTSGGGTGR